MSAVARSRDHGGGGDQPGAGPGRTDAARRAGGSVLPARAHPRRRGLGQPRPTCWPPGTPPSGRAARWRCHPAVPGQGGPGARFGRPPGRGVAGDHRRSCAAAVVRAGRAGGGAAGPGYPLIVGGRSNGARVACRTAAAVGASGSDRAGVPAASAGTPRGRRERGAPEPSARARCARRERGAIRIGAASRRRRPRARRERGQGSVRDPRSRGRHPGGGPERRVPRAFAESRGGGGRGHRLAQ